MLGLALLLNTSLSAFAMGGGHGGGMGGDMGGGVGDSGGHGGGMGGSGGGMGDSSDHGGDSSGDAGGSGGHDGGSGGGMGGSGGGMGGSGSMGSSGATGGGDNMGNGFSSTPHDHEMALQQHRQGAAPALKSLMRQIGRRYPGKVLDVRVERTPRGATYVFTILQKTRVRQVRVPIGFTTRPRRTYNFNNRKRR